MGCPIYLRDHDTHNRVLEYHADTGEHRLLARHVFEQRGASLAFGWFGTEAGVMFGVYAAPAGPVFFRNAQRITCAFGLTRAYVEEDAATGLCRFVLVHEGAAVFSIDYARRSPLHAHPYDTAVEDTDRLRAIASGMERRQFFDNYSRSVVQEKRAEPRHPPTTGD